MSQVATRRPIVRLAYSATRYSAFDFPGPSKRTSMKTYTTSAVCSTNIRSRIRATQDISNRRLSYPRGSGSRSRAPPVAGTARRKTSKQRSARKPFTATLHGYCELRKPSHFILKISFVAAGGGDTLPHWQAFLLARKVHGHTIVRGDVEQNKKAFEEFLV